MNSTVQTATGPVEGGSSVGIQTTSPAEVVSFVRRWFGEPLRGATEAVTDAVRHPPPGLHATAPTTEADRQIMRLNQLRSAQDGWAGPGSIAPNTRSLDAAIELINRLRYFPLPVPMASIGSHGNAGLFWSDNRLYADIELLDDGRVGYLLHVHGSDAIDDEGDVPDVGLPPALARAFASAYLSNRR